MCVNIPVFFVSCDFFWVGGWIGDGQSSINGGTETMGEARPRHMLVLGEMLPELGTSVAEEME
jgi:hypothetical protein